MRVDAVNREMASDYDFRGRSLPSLAWSNDRRVDSHVRSPADRSEQFSQTVNIGKFVGIRDYSPLPYARNSLGFYDFPLDNRWIEWYGQLSE
jgi:hypothetical protein